MVYNKTDPDDAVDFWLDTFVTIYDKHAPYKHKWVKSFRNQNGFPKNCRRQSGTILLPLQQWGDHPQPGGSPRGG